MQNGICTILRALLVAGFSPLTLFSLALALLIALGLVLLSGLTLFRVAFAPAFQVAAMGSVHQFALAFHDVLHGIQHFHGLLILGGHLLLHARLHVFHHIAQLFQHLLGAFGHAILHHVAQLLHHVFKIALGNNIFAGGDFRGLFAFCHILAHLIGHGLHVILHGLLQLIHQLIQLGSIRPVFKGIHQGLLCLAQALQGQRYAAIFQIQRRFP